MNIRNKTKWTLKILATYGFLWLLTATWGEHDVDCDFDRQLSVGDGGNSLGGDVVPVPVVRIYELANAHDFQELENKKMVPPYPWRYRRHGVAVAPFIIIDEIAWITSGLGGESERRLIFWFFGYSKTHVLKAYWGV